ncbi:MAG: hypothetical protein ACRC2T_11615 [Thermoguttaceae bacterium]
MNKKRQSPGSSQIIRDLTQNLVLRGLKMFRISNASLLTLFSFLFFFCFGLVSGQYIELQFKAQIRAIPNPGPLPNPTPLPNPGPEPSPSPVPGPIPNPVPHPAPTPGPNTLPPGPEVSLSSWVKMNTPTDATFEQKKQLLKSSCRLPSGFGINR